MASPQHEVKDHDDVATGSYANVDIDVEASMQQDDAKASTISSSATPMAGPSSTPRQRTAATLTASRSRSSSPSKSRSTSATPPSTPRANTPRTTRGALGRTRSGTAGRAQQQQQRVPLSKLVALFGAILVVTQIIVIPILMPSAAIFVVPTMDEISSYFSDMFDFETDAIFNNVRVTLKYDGDKPLESFINCVGDTLDADTAWMYRSCRFSNLCLDTNTSKFFVVVRPDKPHAGAGVDPDDGMNETQTKPPLSGMYSSTFMSAVTGAASFQGDKSMAIGGINPRWDSNDKHHGIDKMKWFPDVRSEAPEKYYQLPSRVLMVPFHSMGGHNVGHLVWDDLLPIFNLLHIFGMIGIDGLEHMLLRWKARGRMYGGCDIKEAKAEKCAANFEQFLPLMGVDPETFSTVDKTRLASLDGTTHKLQSSVVCVKHAVAGIGKLTDHGKNDHGWDRLSEFPPPPQPQGADPASAGAHQSQMDRVNVQNTGRGSLLYDFRTYVMYNMGLPIESPEFSQQPMKIVFSMHSSSEEERNVDFNKQIEHVTKQLPNADVEQVELSKMSVYDQLSLVSNTTVFVTAAGGGAMTATFLPRGASVIVYYPMTAGFNYGEYKLTNAPAPLDWDLLNNMGYVRVHWMPLETMNTPESLDALEDLLLREWKVIDAMPN